MNCDSWKTKAIALSLDDFAASLHFYIYWSPNQATRSSWMSTNTENAVAREIRSEVHFYVGGEWEGEHVNPIFMAEGSFNNNKIRFSTQKKSGKTVNFWENNRNRNRNRITAIHKRFRLKGRNGLDVIQLRTDCVESFNYPRSSISTTRPCVVDIVGHCGLQCASVSRISPIKRFIGR